MRKFWLTLTLIFAISHQAAAADFCADLLSRSGLNRNAQRERVEEPISNPISKVMPEPAVAAVAKAVRAKQVANEVTSGFIGYLGTLVENQIIGDKELMRLIVNLERGVLENPILEEDTQISSSLYIHREGLEEYIKTAKIDEEELLEWAKKNLKEKDRVRVRREETKVETQ